MFIYILNKAFEQNLAKMYSLRCFLNGDPLFCFVVMETICFGTENLATTFQRKLLAVMILARYEISCVLCLSGYLIDKRHGNRKVPWILMENLLNNIFSTTSEPI